MSNLASKKRPVDEAFERMFGYAFGTPLNVLEPIAAHRNDETTVQDELIRIFGKARATRILRSFPKAAYTVRQRRKSATKRPRTSYRQPQKPLVSTTSTATKTRRQTPLDYKNISLPSSLKAEDETMETKVFAGQEIQVKSNTAKAVNPKKTSKLDTVLSQLSGPSKVSTVQKTSSDWETFKESDKQLQEELEQRAQSKDAYLVKQDFLQRVDHRTFELEKEERDKERAKRAMPG